MDKTNLRLSACNGSKLCKSGGEEGGEKEGSPKQSERGWGEFLSEDAFQETHCHVQ